MTKAPMTATAFTILRENGMLGDAAGNAITLSCPCCLNVITLRFVLEERFAVPVLEPTPENGFGYFSSKLTPAAKWSKYNSRKAGGKAKKKARK
jgi:hypothetical protein